MESFNIALFGEAEKGQYHTAYFCKTLDQLVDSLGHPPPNSLGLFYAIQALLYHHQLLFFRVKEEGYSEQDYFSGIHLLKNQEVISKIAAICIPGVGNNEIIEAVVPVCAVYHSILVITESDLYDYLTINLK